MSRYTCFVCLRSIHPVLFQWNQAWGVIPGGAKGFGQYAGSTIHEGWVPHGPLLRSAWGKNDAPLWDELAFPQAERSNGP